MAPSFSPSDSDLIVSLHALSAKSPKLVKSSVYPAPADASIQVRSWKMNEFKYYDIPSPFPTLARGLFTREVVDVDTDGVEEKKEEKKPGEKKYQIVVRGYDKFFNIGEVPWTTWSSLEEHTAPPYTLSLKSNGCIIFIAALTPSKLVVTSKHSLGPVGAAALSHAQAGEGWLRRYLEKGGKTEADLAGVLWEKNWTAIAELCDDSFEEHVLGYPPEKTGLHLHGLNVRSRDFITMPHEVVDAFAEEWGFIKTLTKTVNSIKEVKDFTSACAENGEWNGEPVEGFVVRTHVTEPPTSGRNSGSAKGKGKDKEVPAGEGSASARSPYKPGSSFFFKVKFDEPYMMYRDWREVTKSLLSACAKGGPTSMSPAALPKSKMRRAETKLYVDWVIGEIKRDREAFKDYGKGKGIIKTRERFLRWLETGEGRGGLEKVEKEEGKEEEGGGERKFGKTIIVPVAIPGCGKTAISVALAHIFGWGHTQSDDVQAKKPAPIFIKNVTNLLAKHDVVIADKNNHLTQHRTALRTATQGFSPPVRLLALNWSRSLASQPPATVHRICSDRVIQRGANHQSLRPDVSAAKAHEEVIWMFINTTEELTEAEVDDVVEMELEESESEQKGVEGEDGDKGGLEKQVRRAVAGVVNVLGLEEPAEEKIRDALRAVGAYKPKVIKPDAEPKGKKGSGASAASGAASGSGAGATTGKGTSTKGGPRYYGLLPEVDLTQLLDARLGEDKTDVPPAMREFWAGLKKEGRVAKRPHVTVVHKNAIAVAGSAESANGADKGSEEEKAEKAKELWDRCAALQAGATPTVFRGRLGSVVCDGRVMAITFEDLAVEGGASASASARGQGSAATAAANANADSPGTAFIKALPDQVRKRLHITVGTRTGAIQPVEAKVMVESLRAKGETGAVRKVGLEGVVVFGRVKGLFG